MFIQPFDECLRKKNFEYFYMDKTESTMKESKNKIKSLKKNFIILSNHQTNGKGRRKKIWHSPKGNIYCSINIFTDSTIEEYFKFSMLTSIAIKNSLEYVGLNDVFLKWPNDVYIKNEKISGILQESIINKYDSNILIIGIGINFISSPKIENYGTTFIRKFNKNLEYFEYFNIFINYFLDYYEKFILYKDLSFIKNYKNSQMLLNKEINIRINDNELLKGTFLGINDNGSLILEHKNKILNIFSGEIQI